MNPQYQKQELLEEHKSFHEQLNLGWIIKVVALVFVICIGLYALAQQIIKGHIITGMRDNVVWGVYIVNFVFVLGLSYAGALIAGIFHLGRVEWAKPLQRILKLITVSALIIGPFYILLCLGRPERLFNLFMYPRLQSPIIWDVIAIVTDLIFCIVYMYFTYIKDFALLRDNAETLNLNSWRYKFYKFLALGYQNTPREAKLLNQSLDIMAAIIIPTTIIAYSLLAWLFGMNLKVGWHSSIFGPFFVLSAVYSGIALLILIMWIFRKSQKLDKTFNDEHFIYLGFALVVLSLFYGYFYFSDYITDWYNMQETYNHLWDKLFDFSQYGYYFVISIFFVAFLPSFIIGLPWFRSINSIAFTSLLVLLGLWMMRYLMIVPVLETPYLPIQDVRPDWVHYSATWIEWSLTLAGVALFTLLFVIAAKLAPIAPVSDMLEKEGENKIKIFWKTRLSRKKLSVSE
jgi:Ni/Fe-hydrogenase subunit HybB-like protein